MACPVWAKSLPYTQLLTLEPLVLRYKARVKISSPAVSSPLTMGMDCPSTVTVPIATGPESNISTKRVVDWPPGGTSPSGGSEKLPRATRRSAPFGLVFTLALIVTRSISTVVVTIISGTQQQVH